ncbi:AraC family transcriptional regulator [Polaribacter cellanae]|uniref:AraC family transcriptional regulator n=1 Tax=Polaribacter cellanae TaxID=2818493 RepID=A0A975CRP3_9FLAO|nr:helix-turn-helix transcriptional regulator [Polaribacter cellanae]QTE24274.1 AraC family transcriptional regulator [Polaribacter cellanae]
MKNQNLNKFNIYEHLKELRAHSLSTPYFLANQDTYKQASINFPFRTFAYGIGITYSGKRRPFQIGSMKYYTDTGSLVTIGPGIVCQWKGEYQAVHDTIYFTEELFKDGLKPSFLKEMSCFNAGGNHVINISSQNVENFKVLFQSLKDLSDNEDLVPGIIYSILMLVKRCHRIDDSQFRNTSQKEKLTSDFKKLIPVYFQENKEVAFYANKLNISPKYLSEVLLSETGNTAKSLILQHIFLEAKSLLRQTSMTVQEICFWLGYDDASYFTKAFKKHEGMTPLSYRKL